MTRLALLLLLACLAGAPAAAAPAEPDGYRTGVMRAPTPATLTGADVLDLAGLLALMPARPLLLDVGPTPVKPETLPAGTVWAPNHRSIPGAVWLPGAGDGALPPDRAAELLGVIDGLVAGDRARPVVVFCLPDCWASWNIGKRLVGAGYTRVAWFPAGIDGWQATQPTAPVAPHPW